MIRPILLQQNNISDRSLTYAKFEVFWMFAVSLRCYILYATCFKYPFFLNLQLFVLFFFTF